MGKPYLFIVTGRRLEPRLNVPTWRIDTSDGCQPDASQLIKAVWGENKGPF